MGQPPGQQSMPHHFAPGVDRGRGKEALEFFPFNRRSMVILTRSDFSAPPNPSYLFCFRQSHKLNNSEHRHIAHSCELKFFPLLLAVWTAKRLVDLPRDWVNSYRPKHDTLTTSTRYPAPLHDGFTCVLSSRTDLACRFFDRDKAFAAKNIRPNSVLNSRWDTEPLFDHGDVKMSPLFVT